MNKLFLLLMLFGASDLFGQSDLESRLVPDSIILKYRVKEVTEHIFVSEKKPDPSWTTIEKFDSSGRLLHRTSINYTYHKFITDFEYDEKKQSVKVLKREYDWNPYNTPGKRDTTFKKTTEKISLNKYRRLAREPFIIYHLDSLGRIAESCEAIKCGEMKDVYTYDTYNRPIELKHYRSIHDDEPTLEGISRFEYDQNGRMIRQIHYFEFKEPEVGEHGREVETTYRYNNLGLLSEKIIVNRYLGLKNSKPNTSRYTYDYTCF